MDPRREKAVSLLTFGISWIGEVDLLFDCALVLVRLERFSRGDEGEPGIPLSLSVPSAALSRSTGSLFKPLESPLLMLMASFSQIAIATRACSAAFVKMCCVIPWMTSVSVELTDVFDAAVIASRWVMRQQPNGQLKFCACTSTPPQS